MFLEIIGYNNIHYLLTFDNVLNVIIGDSSTGKTALAEIASKRRFKIKNTDASYVSVYSPDIDIDMLRPNTILLVDVDDYELKYIKPIFNIKRADICIVYLGRKYIKNLPVSINNTFLLKNVKGITKNIRFPFKELSIQRFNNVITEDSQSGCKFFKNIFKETDTCYGNSNVIESVNNDTLVVFDAVGFGGYIEEFMREVSNKNGSYLGYKSFEGFLLEELFNYVDIPIAFNIEESLLNKLKEYNITYSKHTGCTEEYCYNCNLQCKQSSRELLKNSKYSSLLEFYVNKHNKSALDLMVESSKQ